MVFHLLLLVEALQKWLSKLVAQIVQKVPDLA